MLKDPKQTMEEVTAWIRDYVESNIPGAYVVVGVSGGKDSSVAAALCAKALGKDRVVGVTMPDGVQPDINDSNQLIEHLGIHHIEVNIGKMTKGFLETFEENEAFRALTGKEGLVGESKINMAPRVRMTTLYGVAQSMPGGGLVVNTCNASEDYVGYSTKFGDAAGDFSPMAAFTVEEVLQLGEALGLPHNLIYKTPSDGLSGKSDEDKLGFTYAALGRYMETGICEDAAVKEKIDRLHKRNLHKLLPMPTFKK